jgi:hypothetical protein
MPTISQLKAELDELNLRYKLEKKRLRAEKRAKRIPLLAKVSRWADSVTLRLCEPFESRAQSIRYKLRDPDGYMMDQMYEATVETIKRFRKIVSAGKELSDSQVAILIQADTALTLAKIKNIGIVLVSIWF